MSTDAIKPGPWTVESSRVEFSDRFLTHRMDRCVTERGFVLDPYHVVELKEWCHAVALTPAGELVLIEEYRHGGGAVVRGLPAGTVEQAEDPQAAMARELAEETGYEAAAWIALPVMWANPALMNNRAHSFLALDARPTGTRSLDPGETIEVVLRPATDAFGDLMAGRLCMTSLHVAGMMMAREYARAHAAEDPRLAPLAG
ncbi:MAG: NUDIX hydrolase [Thalassobaculum sp.]|uniref:NUDIX hydrolase n=1 Tax=Thalassobaculum sp. TaxID=2022740 RepID=UPI0032F07B92